MTTRFAFCSAKAGPPAEIPNVWAITSCPRRQKAGLSDACRTVFEQ